MIDRVRRAAKKIMRHRRPTLTFQVKLTDHCNLNCIGCNVFSPISKPACLDVESYTRDMARIRKVFGDRCDVILLGGEPLLHPGLVELLSVSRRLFRRSRISILTNGLLMLRQGEAFWNALRENRITVQVTKYPVRCDYDGIMERCRDRGIVFEYHDGDKPKTIFTMQAISPRGTGDAVANYARCSVRNCTTLSDGKLYPCIVAPNIKHFNEYFGYDISLSPEDYVDIYKENGARQIMRRLYNRSQPLPFCRYCDIDTKLVNKMSYKRSSKHVSEWVNAARLEE